MPKSRELKYIENKDGHIDGPQARIGWVEVSKTGRTFYYRGRSLQRGNMVRGNHFDTESGEEYWISGVKKRGSNVHWAESVDVHIDDDAQEEYQRIRGA